MLWWKAPVLRSGKSGENQRLPYFVMGNANAGDIYSVTFKHHKLQDSRSFNLYDQRRITA
jgi:hypothetical protein